MQKVLFLYSLFLALLLIGAVSFPDKVSTSVNANHSEIIAHKWVITSVHEPGTGSDLSGHYTATVWQFLEGNRFVESKEGKVVLEGQWSLNGNTLKIRNEEISASQDFALTLLRRNELSLKSQELDIKLLKLID